MSFWPFNIINGYIRADRASKDESDNSTMFYFGAKNPNRRKKKKKQSPASNNRYENNSIQSASSSNRGRDNELTVVKKQDRFEYYRVPLSKNENLHTVAMKYGCSIWELKRANRLWGLQDVHALTSLLVPAPRNSYRAELLAKSGRLVARRSSTAQRSGCVDEADSDLPDDAGDLAVPSPAVSAATAGAGGVAAAASSDERRPVSLRQAMSSDSLPGGDCDRFLRTLDADLEQIKQSTCFLKDSLPEAADYLTTPAVLPPPGLHRVGWCGDPPSWLRGLKGTGADAGLSWRGAVCLVCVLCLLVPALLYFLIVHGRAPHPHPH